MAGSKNTMSAVINPMLMKGTFTAEQIADKVIAKFPRKKSKDARAKLIRQIYTRRVHLLSSLPKGSKKPAIKKASA